LTLIVFEESMRKITKLPPQGEKWYKKFKIAPEKLGSISQNAIPKP
jgi:hypothetical protein